MKAKANVFPISVEALQLFTSLPESPIKFSLQYSGSAIHFLSFSVQFLPSFDCILDEMHRTIYPKAFVV